MIADVQVIDDQLLALAPLLDRAMVRVHIDHRGRPDPTAGIDAPGSASCCAGAVPAVPW